MYIELANMTLEEVSRITQALTGARLGTYLQSIGGHTYLRAFDCEERSLSSIFDGVLTEV